MPQRSDRCFDGPSRRVARLAAVIALALVACHPADDPTAEQAIDSVASAQAEGAVLAASTDGIAESMTSVEAAERAVARASEVFGSACATATLAGSTAEYVLTDCSGRFGLQHVSGAVFVTFAVASDGLHARAKAAGLSAAETVVQIDAEGVYTKPIGAQNLAITTSGAGRGRRGDDLVRKGTYAVHWDDASDCLTLDGAWSTRILGAAATTVARGYTRCGAACPAAGGAITHHSDPDEVTVEVAFDGSPVAHWSSSRDNEGDVELGCR